MARAKGKLLRLSQQLLTHYRYQNTDIMTPASAYLAVASAGIPTVLPALALPLLFSGPSKMLRLAGFELYEIEFAAQLTYLRKA